MCTLRVLRPADTATLVVAAVGAAVRFPMDAAYAVHEHQAAAPGQTLAVDAGQKHLDQELTQYPTRGERQYLLQDAAV
eukprot:1220498-Pleurochrysis_carterae.AAC.1